MSAPAAPGRRIAVVTADTVAAQMAGPAMRAWHLAEALAAEHEVRLLSTNHCSVSHPSFATAEGGTEAVAELVEWCDVFVFQGWIMWDHRVVADADTVVVADVYDPMHLEQLEQARHRGEPHWTNFVVAGSANLNLQLGRADFLICASESQRTFWLGQLAALGRVNPALYADDPTYRSFLDVVPFGVPDEPPVRTGPGLRGALEGIGPDDRVLLWNGGIYNWFDPQTLVRALARLVAEERFGDVRLVFMGMRHPNPDVPAMAAAAETVALADDLGLTGRHVFFNTGWVPFEERQNFLLDADVVVSTHRPGLETEFSFRTRILDALWAGRPVVTTEGGALPDLVARRDLGATVPAGDPDVLAAALAGLLDDPDRRAACGARARTAGDEYRWSEVVAPLVEFCRRPRRAPDLLDPARAADRRYDLGTGFAVRNPALRRGIRLLVLADQGRVGELVRRKARRPRMDR